MLGCVYLPALHATLSKAGHHDPGSQSVSSSSSTGSPPLLVTRMHDKSSRFGMLESATVRADYVQQAQADPSYAKYGNAIGLSDMPRWVGIVSTFCFFKFHVADNVLCRLGATNIDAIAKFITKFKNQTRASDNTRAATDRRGGISAVLSPRRNGRALLSARPQWSVESDGYSELVVLTAVHQITTDFGGKRPGLKKLRVCLAAVGVRVSEKRLRKILNDQNSSHSATEKAITSGGKSQGKSVCMSRISRNPSSARTSPGTAVLRSNAGTTVAGLARGIASSQEPRDRDEHDIADIAHAVRVNPRHRLEVTAVDLMPRKRSDPKHNSGHEDIITKTNRKRGECVNLAASARLCQQNGQDDGISMGTFEVVNGIDRRDERFNHKTSQQKMVATVEQVRDRNEVAGNRSRNHKDLITTELALPLADQRRSGSLSQDVLSDSSKEKFYQNKRGFVPRLQSGDRLATVRKTRTSFSHQHRPAARGSTDDHTEHSHGSGLLHEDATQPRADDSSTNQQNDPTHCADDRKLMLALPLRVPAVKDAASCVDTRSDDIVKDKQLSVANDEGKGKNKLTSDGTVTMDELVSADPPSDEPHVEKSQRNLHCNSPQHNTCKNSQTPIITSASVADGDLDQQSRTKDVASSAVEPHPDFDVLQAVAQITREAGGTRPGFKKLRALLLAKGIRVSEKRLRKWLKNVS